MILSFWNPAIHHSKEFHLPLLPSHRLDIVGFGFDPVSHDYKVAICYRSFNKPHLYHAVYSSNSNSWIHSHFDDPDYEMLISTKFRILLIPTTMVKDSPYWTYFTNVPSNKNEVIFSLDALKFDATNNKFKLLPRFSSDFGNDKRFKVVNMRDLLTLMAYEPCTTGKLDVYSLDEDDKGCGGVWSKMYRFGPFEKFWRFKDLKQGFKYGDEFVFYEYSKIHCYDYKTDTFECILGTKPHHTFKDCFTYTPSLVFLKGMTSIYNSEKLSPALGHHSTTPERLISSLRDQRFAVLKTI